MTAASFCGDCPGLTFEDWPKGAKVARCFGPVEEPWRGRVVHYSGTGVIHSVKRPVWCNVKGENDEVHP